MPPSTDGLGGAKGSIEASRTDDLIAITLDQFSRMAPGPKMIAGDLNAAIDSLPTLQAMIREQGWTDLGNRSGLCNGMQGQATCQSNGTVRESRIDYICQPIDDTLCGEMLGGSFWNLSVASAVAH